MNNMMEQSFYKDMTKTVIINHYDRSIANSIDEVCPNKRKYKMAKEHFKFDFEEWMAEELIPETTGKNGMKQCVKYYLVGSRHY